jgi:hypothetical protein
MSRMITAILIDPFACTVTQAIYDGDDIENIYSLLSHETMEVTCFTAAYPRALKGQDAILVDDEGLFKGCERFFRIDGYPDPMAGKGLVVGADKEGTSISAQTSLGQIAERVTFLQLRRKVAS